LTFFYTSVVCKLMFSPNFLFFCAPSKENGKLQISLAMISSLDYINFYINKLWP
jgi:hypothetical protein